LYGGGSGAGRGWFSGSSGARPYGKRSSYNKCDHVHEHRKREPTKLALKYALVVDVGVGVVAEISSLRSLWFPVGILDEGR
jgi:hypothetical protein